VIRWQLELLWPLVSTLLALAIFALYVFSHSDRHYRLKLVLIPGLLAVVVFSFTWIGDKMGYAHPGALPASFEYVAHKLILENNRKTWIDILVVSRKPLERDARLHRMPWTKALEDSLKRASRMQQEGGGRIEMDGRGNGDEYPEWMPRRVMPQDDMPKDPLPEQRDLLAPRGPAI
jgi:hypothetical protein